MDCKGKVLIIRLSSLGDVIFNIPLACILKKNGYEVSWLVGKKGIEVIEKNPCVDKVFYAPIEEWKKSKNIFKNLLEFISIIKKLRKEKFDIALDTHMLMKSMFWTMFCGAKRRIISKSAREFSILGGNEIIEKVLDKFNVNMVRAYLKYAEYLGMEVKNIEFSLPPATEEIVKSVDELLSDINNEKPLVTIAPATTWKGKHWEKENWKKLVEKIENDYTIIFTGGKKENDLIEYINQGKHLNLAGKTSVSELIEVLRRSDLVLSLDSGTTHLARATQKPKIISIFCCTPIGLYAPIEEENRYISLSGTLPCQPCHHRKCLAKDKYACTKIPTVQEVLTVINHFMQKI